MENQVQTGAKIGYWVANVFLCGYIFLLAGGFYFQFVLNEFPCPLCMIQRYFMMLACLAPISIFISIKKGNFSLSKYMRAYGIAILSALGGLSAAVRHILLHIAPGDPGYGSAVLGLHNYTYSAISFLVVLFFSGLMMFFGKETYPQGIQLTKFTKVSLWVFLFLLVANLVVVFVELGFNFLLPDDPVRYELLHQLGF